MYRPFDLQGRGVVVTGGNGGIGLGMARALLASGANVAIWGERIQMLQVEFRSSWLFVVQSAPARAVASASEAPRKMIGSIT